MKFSSEPVAFLLPFGAKDSYISDGFLSDDEYLLGDLQIFTGGIGQDVFEGFEHNISVVQYRENGVEASFQFYLSGSLPVVRGLFFKDVYTRPTIIRNVVMKRTYYFTGLKLRLISDFVPFHVESKKFIPGGGLGDGAVFPV
ncbi:hypothetical protein [Tenacibaculum piscium]|uniref:hypothetical protein n=1 Tax=Tenacibaculum piscium TaxID=1458515 RepID=UPI001F3609CA|nr:hypothetical protein [Tenacibaculum piscium]